MYSSAEMFADEEYESMYSWKLIVFLFPYFT